MTALTDPISGLRYGWALGEDNWNTGMDSNLVQLGATINIAVLDFVASPVVTTNGTRYIVTTGSGDFVGQDNKLAARVGGAWVFYALPEGCIVYDEDTNKHYKFEGGVYVTLVDLSAYLTTSTAASTYQTQSGMSSYATTSSLTSGLLSNLTPTVNTQTGTSYTVGTVTTDNDGKTYLRMDNAASNTALFTTAQTKPISVRQAGAGTTTLVADTGVTLNGTLAFTAQHQTKTVIPIGSGVYDVVG